MKEIMKYTKGRKIYIGVSAFFLVVCMGIIFYLSSQVATESAETSGSVLDILEELFGITLSQDFVRTVAHLCEFAGFGFLMSNFIFSVKDKPLPLLSVALAWGYAWIDEIHQLFVPGRAFQLSDLMVDLCGITLGTLFFSAIALIIKRKSASE